MNERVLTLNVYYILLQTRFFWHYLQFRVWLTWSVNQTSTEADSVLTVFIIVKQCGEIFINCTNDLFGTKVNKTFDVCWKSFLTRLQCIETSLTVSNFGLFFPSLSVSTSFCYVLTISLFQKLAILICRLFLFQKQFCFWFYLDKFELTDFQLKFRAFWW